MSGAVPFLRRSKSASPGAVRLLPPGRTQPIGREGGVRSVQEAEVTLPAAVVRSLWRPEYLERLARAYWRYLSRISLHLLRVVYAADSRTVVLLFRPFALLRFHAPEYEVADDGGTVTWRIDRGLLVQRSRRGRGSPVDLGAANAGATAPAPRPSGCASRSRCATSTRGCAGPGRFSRFGTLLYAQTQMRIHEFVTRGLPARPGDGSTCRRRGSARFPVKYRPIRRIKQARHEPLGPSRTRHQARGGRAGGNARPVSTAAVPTSTTCCPCSTCSTPSGGMVGVTARAPLSLPPGGAHWYVVRRVGYPDRETFEATFARVESWLDGLVEETGVPLERTVLGGFSQGAVMSYALGLGAGRPAPAAILALSGFLPEVEGFELDLESRRGLPVAIGHGSYDPVIPVEFGRAARDALSQAGLDVTYRESPMAHTIDPGYIDALRREWLPPCSRASASQANADRALRGAARAVAGGDRERKTRPTARRPAICARRATRRATA